MTLRERLNQLVAHLHEQAEQDSLAADVADGDDAIRHDSYAAVLPIVAEQLEEILSGHDVRLRIRHDTL